MDVVTNGDLHINKDGTFRFRFQGSGTFAAAPPERKFPFS
jgi:hypothetical protein